MDPKPLNEGPAHRKSQESFSMENFLQHLHMDSSRFFPQVFLASVDPRPIPTVLT